MDRLEDGHEPIEGNCSKNEKTSVYPKSLESVHSEASSSIKFRDIAISWIYRISRSQYSADSLKV